MVAVVWWWWWWYGGGGGGGMVVVVVVAMTKMAVIHWFVINSHLLGLLEVLLLLFYPLLGHLYQRLQFLVGLNEL